MRNAAPGRMRIRRRLNRFSCCETCHDQARQRSRRTIADRALHPSHGGRAPPRHHLFGILWATVFNAVTSAIVASGGAVVLVAGSSASETFLSIFDAVAEFILGIFGAIADVLSSLFDW